MNKKVRISFEVDLEDEQYHSIQHSKIDFLIYALSSEINKLKSSNEDDIFSSNIELEDKLRIKSN